MTRGIPVIVLAATGYVGGEALRLIAGHPTFELKAAVSGSRSGDPVAAVFPHLAAAWPGQSFTTAEQAVAGTEPGSRLAVMSAAPHGASAGLIAEVLERAAARDLDVHVVDASADFRFRTKEAYEAVYGAPHGAAALLEHFCCALPEHVSGVPARHIGHPGCFATAILLAAVPLLKSGLTDDELFVTGITGSTGSGQSPQPGTHHPERHSNLYAYKPLTHRHGAEVVALAEAASGRRARLHFVPHSGPFARGIYVTLSARAGADATTDTVVALFEAAYREAPFVDIVAGMPRLKTVVASNRCHIGVTVSDGTVVVASAIDNLVKGAAGGALQWMNRLFDLPETAGLLAPAPAWT